MTDQDCIRCGAARPGGPHEPWCTEATPPPVIETLALTDQDRRDIGKTFVSEAIARGRSVGIYRPDAREETPDERA